MRIKVEPLVWLPPEHGIPIHDEAVWSKLSFTKAHSQSLPTGQGPSAPALAPLSPDDGDLLQKLLRAQAIKPREYPLEPNEAKLFEANTVRRAEGSIAVSVPDNDPEPERPQRQPHTRVDQSPGALGSHRRAHGS